MNLTEIFDRIITLSGRFLQRKSTIEIDLDAFSILVEHVLAQYNEYHPFSHRFSQTINTPRSIDFNTMERPHGYRVPIWIANAVPVMSPYNPMFTPYGYNQKSIEGEPLEAPTDYNEGILTVPLSGSWDITAVYHHELVTFIDDNKTAYKTPTISVKDRIFFNLLQGEFLKGIGRSRRQFTLEAMPIAMDGAELISEAEQITDKAVEDLQTIQRISLVW